MSLNIEKFSPKKAELVELSAKYSSLVIEGVDDKNGYMLVDDARKDLKRQRVEIQKNAKELRAEALSFQKSVIALEKELVGIIEPLEIELRGKQEQIDNEKLKIIRQEMLPERKERLNKIGVQLEDDFILLMDDAKFESFYNEKNSEYLAEKERLLKEAEEKLAREKELEEARKQARIEAEVEAERARKLAEEEAARKVEEAKAKAELEKQKAIEEMQAIERAAQQKILDDQKAAERARIEAEEQAAKVLAEEAAAKAKLEKQKAFKTYLASIGYEKETCKIESEVRGGKHMYIVYKQIGVYSG